MVKKSSSKRKRIREKIALYSTESKHFYTTIKNKRNTVNKLKFHKYDPVLRKHVIYEEGKIGK